MNPDHEARPGLFIRDVDSKGNLDYAKLINTHDNEKLRNHFSDECIING